jgi:hypothetical protein
MEQWARWRLKPQDETPWTWPIEVITDDGPEQVLSEDVEVCKTLLPKLDAHPAFVNDGSLGYHVWIEEKVDFGIPLHRGGKDLTGTCDLILMTPNEFEILDYKFGRYPVEPLCPQLKLYALGAGAVVWGGPYAQEAQQIRSVRLTVAQPALNTENPYTSVEQPVDEMVKWVEEAKHWVEARDKGRGTQYEPSDKACYFCQHRNNCAARLATAAQGLVQVGEPDPVQKEPPLPLAPVEQMEELTEKYGTQDPANIDNATLSRILTLSGYLEGFLKDMREEAKSRLMKGIGIPGWKVIAGRRSRRWTKDEEEIDRIIRGEWKVPKEDKLDAEGNIVKLGCYEVKLKSPAAMEKMVHSQLSKKRKEEFASLWEMKAGSPVLAPQDDPAPALNPSAEWLTPSSAEIEPTFDWE